MARRAQLADTVHTLPYAAQVAYADGQSHMPLWTCRLHLPLWLAPETTRADGGHKAHLWHSWDSHSDLGAPHSKCLITNTEAVFLSMFLAIQPQTK